MAPSVPLKRLQTGVEQVRARLLTSLHLNKLHPGDRVLSVRRLADITGMNRKTVHRAYKALAHEGFLVVRPGSGTFIAETASGPSGKASSSELLAAVNRCRAEAAQLGLSPEVFAEFLQTHLGAGLQGLPIAIAECNYEQIELIALELDQGLGISCRPVLLRELESDPKKALAGTWGIVTTDCHRSEVAKVASCIGAPVYRVAMDPDFPQRLALLAKQGPLVMVVRDRRFAAVFLRLLRQMSVPPDAVAHFKIVESSEARAAFRETGPGGAVYLSPLVEKDLVGRIPDHLRRVDGQWHLAPGTLERLRARLALDLAMRHHEGPGRA